jgi:hypothetical protein
MLIHAHFSDGQPAIAYGVLLQFKKAEGSDDDPIGDYPPGHHKPPIPENVAVVTDSSGVATFNVPDFMTFQNVTRVTRASAGSFRFNAQGDASRLDITITGWPSPVAELRDVLLGPAGIAVKAMADTVLTNSQGMLAKLVQVDKVDTWTAEDGDNPHIRAGAILMSLSISCALARTDAAANAALKGVAGILTWLEHRRHPAESGYFLRWKQAELDSRAGDNWKAEPSLDEYSGLLLGLSWLRKLGPLFRVPSPELLGRANTLWNGIRDYLKRTEGWLVRPGARDLTARGPDLAASATILTELFGYRNDHPLALSDNVKGILERSKKYYDEYSSGNNGFKDAYGSTIKLADALLKMQSADEALLLSELALDLLAFFGAIANPLVGSLFFMLAGAVDAIRGVYDDNVLKVTSFDLWRLFGAALGSPYRVDGGGFNAEIFDRNNLAAFWAGNVGLGQVAASRYTRPLQADRDGWRILTLAGKYCFAQTGVIGDLADSLNAEVGHFRAMSEVPSNLETIEGFVLGWSLLCFVADVDPGIEWAKYVASLTSTSPIGRG